MKAAIVRPEGEDFVAVEMDGHLFLLPRLEWSQAARRGKSVLRNGEVKAKEREAAGRYLQ
jgi:hypothetical protein